MKECHWKIITICLVSIGLVLVISGIIHRCTTHIPDYGPEIDKVEDALDSQGVEQLERKEEREERIIEENSIEQQLREEIEEHLRNLDLSNQVSVYTPYIQESRCQLICK